MAPQPDFCVSHGPALDIALLALAHTLDGELHTGQGNHGQSALPPVWNNLLKGPSPVLQAAQPSCYVTCKSKEDVLKCVQFATEHSMPVHAKGSGHHYGGACLAQDGMVLDLSQMKQITLDPATRTATIQPGVTTRELREATAPHGLHFPGGHLSSVGCSGFILGGGNGWGVTMWGAAVDNVIRFEAILPRAQSPDPTNVHGQIGNYHQPSHGSCQLVEVTADSDPELFKGLKGAGAFLAIVTEFTVKLHPVPPSLPCITAIFPVDQAPQVAQFYRELHATAPRSVEASCSFFHMTEEPHAPVICIGCTAFEERCPHVEECFDKVRGLMPDKRLALYDTTPPYLEALAVLDPAWEFPGLCLYGHGMFIPPATLDEELVKELQRHTEGMTSHRSLILIAPGAPSAPTPSSLCFRDCFFLAPYAMWARTDAGAEGDGDERHAAWVKGVRAAVGSRAVGLYMNEVMLNEEGMVQQCYDTDTYTALTALKQRCDPLGLLRSL